MKKVEKAWRGGTITVDQPGYCLVVNGKKVPLPATIEANDVILVVPEEWEPPAPRLWSRILAWFNKPAPDWFREGW